MYLQGVVLADDGLVDLVTAAVRCDGREMKPDGSYRGRFARAAPEAEIDERVSAALTGAAVAFEEAAMRWSRRGRDGSEARGS
jgi:hypothetical protein